jgi:small subunit ribosomal protein S17
MSEDNTTTANETTTAEASDVAPSTTATAQRDEGSAGDESHAARGESEADAEPAVDTAASADHQDETDVPRAARKVREGMVTSAGMDKTIVVTVTDRVRHAKYNKFVLRSKKLYTHDETNDAGVGDRVRVMETRPMSKNKRWRLDEILERAR